MMIFISVKTVSKAAAVKARTKVLLIQTKSCFRTKNRPDYLVLVVLNAFELEVTF